MPPGRARMRQILESRLENLLQSYAEVNEQIVEMIDRDDRNRLKRKADSLYREILELDDQLRALDIEASDGNRDAPDRDIYRAVEWLSQEQHDFLKSWFQTLSESLAEQLPDWCHDAVPHQLRASIPRHAGALEVLDWLIDRGKLSSGEVPLLGVLEQLSPELGDTDRRKTLDTYRQEIALALGVSGTGPGASENEIVAMRVEIWSDAPSEKRCSVQAALCYAGERFPQVKYVKEQKDGLYLHDQNVQQALVIDLCGLLARHRADETQILVEFVLPRDMLSLPVDHWLDRTDEPLGTHVKVVVRSRERLRNASERFGWQNGWNRAMARGQDRIPACLWRYGPDEDKQVRRQVQAGMCVALKFVPDTKQVANLLHRGAAVALWPRRGDGLDALVPQFEAFSANWQLADLPDAMRDIRHQLWLDDDEQSPCYHLTLLWDDPTHHMPEDRDDFLHAPA